MFMNAPPSEDRRAPPAVYVRHHGVSYHSLIVTGPCSMLLRRREALTGMCRRRCSGRTCWRTRWPPRPAMRAWPAWRRLLWPHSPPRSPTWTAGGCPHGAPRPCRRLRESTGACRRVPWAPSVQARLHGSATSRTQAEQPLAWCLSCTRLRGGAPGMEGSSGVAERVGRAPSPHAPPRASCTF